MRIRWALSSVSSDPVSACHQRRNPPAIMPHPKIRIQHDPIDAIVTADQQILVNLTESICHSVRNITGTTLSKATHSGF